MVNLMTNAMERSHISVNTTTRHQPFTKEPIMPTSIPVQVAHIHFPSLNQARIHFRDILHRYSPGQRVDKDDKQQVLDLMNSSGFPYPTSAESEICVMHGRYGRNCFACMSTEKSHRYHSVSIMHSLKRCTSQNVPSDQYK